MPPRKSNISQILASEPEGGGTPVKDRDGINIEVGPNTVHGHQLVYQSLHPKTYPSNSSQLIRNLHFLTRPGPLPPPHHGHTARKRCLTTKQQSQQRRNSSHEQRCYRIHQLSCPSVSRQAPSFSQFHEELLSKYPPA